MKLLRTSLLFSLSALFFACGGGGGSSSTGPGTNGPAVSDLLSYPFVGTKELLVLVVQLDDAPALFENATVGELQALLQVVSDACAQNSYGALDVRFTITNPLVLSIPKSIADYEPETALVRIRADAIEAARQAGYDADTYDREVLFAPGVWPSAAGRGWVRTIWMPNRLAAVLYHEVGHTLGWGHANFWNGDPLGAGTEVNYGDVYDPMGTGQMWFPFRFRHSAPWFKERAGWLDPASVQTVTQPVTYTLSSVEAPNTALGPAALRVRRDEDQEYWIFHRQDEPLVSGGVLVVRQGTNPFEGTQLLDMDRSAPGPQINRVALLPGERFDDPGAEIVIRNVSPAGSGLVQVRVEVNEARQLALGEAPLIEVVVPPVDQGPVDGTVDFAVAVADPDVGLTDGSGIARVAFEILDPVQDAFPILASFERLERPYEWSFDTTTLEDSSYYLAVTAETLDGGSRTVWTRFLVDNATAAGR